MYNKVSPCIFEPKTKIPADYRSVYQLLANVRVGKKRKYIEVFSNRKNA